jgi:hypothetical protein
MRVSARIQRNLDAKDAANRTIDLIRREANFSNRIDYGDGSGTDSLKKCDNTPLILNQNNTSEICYKTVAPSQLLDKYKSAFEGPCVLVRLGPPYKPNGDIDGSLSPKIISPLLDGVSNTSADGCASSDNKGLTAQLASLKTGSYVPGSQDRKISPPNRIASIQINMAAPGVSYSFSTRVSSNLSYDGRYLFQNCARDDGLCGSDSAFNHYLPENANTSSFTGSESKENLFYFKYPYSDYEINQGTCAYSSCSVTVKRSGFTLQLERVDALVFPDKEIRPSR